MSQKGHLDLSATADKPALSGHHRVHTSPSPQLPDSTPPQSYTSQSPHCSQVHTSLSPHFTESQSPRVPHVPKSTRLRVHMSQFTSSPGPHVLKSTLSLTPHRPLVNISSSSPRVFESPIPHPRWDFPVPLLVKAQKTG